MIPLAGVPGAFTSYASPDGRSWAQVREALEGYTGKTGGLMLEVAIWSLGLQLGGAPLEWVAVEQSSKLPEEIRREVWVDFQLAGWGMAEWTVRDAADNGSPSHRVRSLLVARRDGDSGVSLETSRELVTWASDATRRPADREVITRGERKTSGGNAYRMGRVIPAVTGKIRSVDVGEKGGRFTIAEVAKLVTMPPTHPVQGSRTAQCQQLGDVVAPVMACALLGVALGVEWMPHLSRYLGELYPEAHGQAESADTAENSGGDSPAERAPETPAADTEQEPRTVICGPAVYALTVPARVDERGAVARIRDLAARVNVQHQDAPEPALADPFEELRREAAELRRDVEEWAADVAAMAVAEAERIVRAAEQELAELRGLELELMSREAAAVRDALEWAPVALPHRARPWVTVWTTAASWAVFWSAAWHESLAVVRPVR
ncbi:hypothetical protein [Streptomyces sp. NPDC059861]|uniref:hypothetical protein n=1 Tax=Streptomyces sp. NPDC059861 TaxID=3346974 RepID=UPI0036684E67